MTGGQENKCYQISEDTISPLFDGETIVEPGHERRGLWLQRGLVYEKTSFESSYTAFDENIAKRPQV